MSCCVAAYYQTLQHVKEHKDYFNFICTCNMDKLH